MRSLRGYYAVTTRSLRLRGRYCHCGHCDFACGGVCLRHSRIYCPNGGTARQKRVRAAGDDWQRLLYSDRAPAWLAAGIFDAEASPSSTGYPSELQTKNYKTDTPGSRHRPRHSRKPDDGSCSALPSANDGSCSALPSANDGELKPAVQFQLMCCPSTAQSS